jgi:hypothetical protein
MQNIALLAFDEAVSWGSRQRDQKSCGLLYFERPVVERKRDLFYRTGTRLELSYPVEWIAHASQ